MDAGDDGDDSCVVGSFASVQLASKLFLRTIAQFNSFDRTFNVYPLFSYKLNALTTFYAGLTNNYLDYGSTDGFTTTERQFFVKMQYLFRS